MITEFIRSYKSTQNVPEDEMELLDPATKAPSRPGTVLETIPQRPPELITPTRSDVKHDSFSGIIIQESPDFKLKDSLSLLTTSRATKGRKRKWKAWQKLIILNCTLMSLAFICNTSLLIWSLHKPVGTFDSTRLLYRGDCGRTKSIDFWSHMAINILSTIILAGGNYAIQILVAPTREAINKAHCEGHSLSIGVRGFRNWHFIGNWSNLLVSILLVTTFPIHAIYNSVVYSTISSNQVSAAIVTDDFLTAPQVTYWSFMFPSKDTDSGIAGPGFDAYTEGSTGYQALLDLIRDEDSHGNLTSFNNLSTSDCWSALSAKFVNDYSAVLYIADIPSSSYNATVLGEGIASAGGLAYQTLFLGPMPTTWSFQVYNETQTLANINVSYCLALKAEPLCTVELVPAFLAVVIASNLIKALVLLNLLYLSVDPLKTIGDAIASFMNYPDPVTENLSVIRPDIIRNSRRRSRYFSGASRVSWVVVITLCVVYWLVGAAMVAVINSPALSSGQSVTLSQQWKDGFGALEAQTSAELGMQMSFFWSALVANLPQLWLSFIYVLYNGLLTDLIISREWLSYSSERKSLRVTDPEGEQRSTYFLSLPYRFSVPVAGFMAILHWMLSQSLFLGVITSYTLGSSLELEVAEYFNSEAGLYILAWSSLGIMMSMIVGGIMIIAILVLGFCRYKPGMFPAQINSRTISAACHPPEYYRDSTKGVQYGILADLGDGTYHVGFSSGPVMKIVEGDIDRVYD